MSELTNELVESLQSLVANCNNPPDYDPYDEFDTSFERASQSLGEFVDNNSAVIVGGLYELLAIRPLRIERVEVKG